MRSLLIFFIFLCYPIFPVISYVILIIYFGFQICLFSLAQQKVLFRKIFFDLHTYLFAFISNYNSNFYVSIFEPLLISGIAKISFLREKKYKDQYKVLEIAMLIGIISHLCYSLLLSLNYLPTKYDDWNLNRNIVNSTLKSKKEIEFLGNYSNSWIEKKVSGLPDGIYDFDVEISSNNLKKIIIYSYFSNKKEKKYCNISREFQRCSMKIIVKNINVGILGIGGYNSWPKDTKITVRELLINPISTENIFERFSHIKRLVGFADNSNIYAIQVANAGVLFYLISTKLAIRMLVTVIVIISILFSGSISILVSFIAFILFVSKRPDYLFFAFLASMLGFFLAWNFGIHTSLQRIFDIDVYFSRSQIYYEFIDSFLKKPIFGNFTSYSSKTFGHIHSLFLNVLYSFGIFGIFTYVFMILKIKPKKYLFFIALLFIFLSNLLDFFIQNASTKVLIVFLLTSFSEDDQENPETTNVPRKVVNCA